VARHTRIQAQSKDGEQFDVTAHESDSPLLPVAQLERLHGFRPDLVDWVIENTREEAVARRKRTARVDAFVLIERVGGLVAGFLIAFAGIVAAAYLAINGQPWVAAVLGGGTLVSIVTVLVTGRKAPAAPEQGEQKKTK
jgi:hypothetical protein